MRRWPDLETLGLFQPGNLALCVTWKIIGPFSEEASYFLQEFALLERSLTGKFISEDYFSMSTFVRNDGLFCPNRARGIVCIIVWQALAWSVVSVRGPIWQGVLWWEVDGSHGCILSIVLVDN